MLTRIMLFSALCSSLLVLPACEKAEDIGQNIAEADIATQIDGDDPDDPFFEETPTPTSATPAEGETPVNEAPTVCFSHGIELNLLDGYDGVFYEGNTDEGTVVSLQKEITLEGEMNLEFKYTVSDSGIVYVDRVTLIGEISYTGDREMYEDYAWDGIEQSEFDQAQACQPDNTFKGIVEPDPTDEDPREYRVDGWFNHDATVFEGYLLVEFGGKIVDLAWIELPRTKAW